ncbi:unnamed protein product [Pleuronectes platessa]|uniref:Uncharacterized protein n=1 Tax=Pleuronectes platessa TaxID=8262 RepID=A0A9N7USJ9_PLEPL|nr:unnamed protein product [Pleuronectes platessa]
MVSPWFPIPERRGHVRSGVRRPKRSQPEPVSGSKLLADLRLPSPADRTSQHHTIFDNDHTPSTEYNWRDQRANG